MTWSKLGAANAKLKFLSKIPDVNSIDSYLLWGALTYFHDFPVRRDGQNSNPIPVVFQANLSLKNLRNAIKNLVQLTTWSDENAETVHTGFVTADNLSVLSSKVKKLRIGLIAPPSTMTFAARAFGGLKVSTSFEKNDQEVVVGIIDHGIAFAHKGFCALDTAGARTQTRIERFWDQQWGYPAKPPDDFLGEQGEYFGQPLIVSEERYKWKPVPSMGYGRELAAAAINSLIKAQPDETKIYREQLYRPAQQAITHGTHVLGIAAGEQKFYDIAANTKIIAVQMPARPFKNTSGESLSVHLLDAVRYILHHAAGRKVVINLSDGAYAGPHDGTSLLEKALDQHFSASQERLAFVVAAGNQFNEAVHWADTIAPNNTAHIDWRLLPDDKTDSHIEIWLKDTLTQDVLDKVSVSVDLPGQPTSLSVGVDETAIWEVDNKVRATVMFRASPVNGKTRAMIHIALAPTSRHQIPHGICRINLINKSNKPIVFDAYIERDNPALGDHSPTRQSHFVHPLFHKICRSQTSPIDDSSNPSPIKRMGALNSVATCAKVLVVGGFVQKSGAIAAYSAAGPGRAAGGWSAGVDVLAPCDQSASLKGIRSYGTRTGTGFRMNGTSVAAPFVTRKVAALMLLGSASLNVFDPNNYGVTARDKHENSDRYGLGRIKF